MACVSRKSYVDGNRDYCSLFWVIFETTSKFPITFLRLVLRKVEVDRVTGPSGEIDARRKSDLKVILKDLGCT